MSQINMLDLLDNVLFDKPIKPTTKPIEETVIDVQKILGEADGDGVDLLTPSDGGGGGQTGQQPTAPAPAPADGTTPEDQSVQPIPDDSPKLGTLEDYIKRARKIVKVHEPKGDLVLEIALQLEGKSCGKLQIGSEEYETITGWKIILDKFGIAYKAVPEAIKSFRIDCETKYSQTENDSVGISVELSGDGETLGIQVFYNEEGNIMDDLEQALNEFNRRYREYIITAINEKVRV